MSLRQYHSTFLFPPGQPQVEMVATSDLNRASSLPSVQRGRSGSSHVPSVQRGRSGSSNVPSAAGARQTGNKPPFNHGSDSACIEPDTVVFKIPRTSRRQSPCPSTVSLDGSFRLPNSCSRTGSAIQTTTTDDSKHIQPDNNISPDSNNSHQGSTNQEPPLKPPRQNDVTSGTSGVETTPITSEHSTQTEVPTSSISDESPSNPTSHWHNLTHQSCNPITDNDCSTSDPVDSPTTTSPSSPCIPLSRNSSSSTSKRKRSQKFRRKDNNVKTGLRNELVSSAAAQISMWKQRLVVPKPKLKGSHGNSNHSNSNNAAHRPATKPESIAMYQMTNGGDDQAYQLMSPRYKMFKTQRLQHQQRKQQLQNQKATKWHLPNVTLNLEGIPLTSSHDDPIYSPVFPFNSRQYSIDSVDNNLTGQQNGFPCKCGPSNDHWSPCGNGCVQTLDSNSPVQENDPMDVYCRQNGHNTQVDSSLGEFTVVPINNETHLREQESAARNNNDHISNLRVPLHTFEVEGGEPSDSLTQTTITSLLSAKFRDVAKRWKQYGVESPRFRKRIHSKWESMNYDVIDSKLQEKQNADEISKKQLALQWLAQWVIYFFIGLGTAFLAAGVQISVEVIAHQKFDLIGKLFDKCSKEDCLIQPVLIWVALNGGITLLGAALVTYVQPMAAGSGIPMIKSYLNGIRIPGLLTLRCFIAKCVGVVLSILGGLACGKEGPMAHSGGIMGAGLGKGRIPWFGRDINLYSMFRTDHNIRDLVAAGAASGVSAAFGAPVGGTLFSVEEAASFWNTELVWKVFFSAMIACFSTNFLLSAFEGHPTQLSNPGLVRFNTFPNLTFDLIEIPVFIVLAVIGGLTGSLFVVMNYKLTVFRQKYLHRYKWIKIAEAALVAIVSAIVAFILMYTVQDCTTAHPRGHGVVTTKMGCEGDAHNAMSTLFLTTPEGCLKSLLHDPLETYSVLSLVLFIIIFFILGVWTYGLSVSSGVFIPSLAIGAAWGRLIGMGVVHLFPDQAKDVGKYALIGAASQLGGILRTTISLTVIIVECTGDISFGLCIMIALMISKWVGDFFTTGLYDMNVEVSGIPLLSWEPPPLCDHVKVGDFMSQPVMSLLPIEKVGHIIDCLKGETFHGFPVIEQDPSYDLMYRGKLKGIVLRSQLLVLLKHRVFCKEGEPMLKGIELRDFENPYPVPQRLTIKDIELSEDDKDSVMDLTSYMSQTPYIVTPSFSMPRAFRLFRGLGLRHLIVINESFEPVGMITRKDLAVYRAGIKKGMLHMEQLTVENR